MKNKFLVSVVLLMALFTLSSFTDDPGNSNNQINGHEYVDLGLSVKWATCNVGASSPEEYGGYYAWGETEEKSNYDWNTYKWCEGSKSNMTKYRKNSIYGTFDNKTTLDPEDDVAYVKWGGSWRMPTLDEQEELRENCTWEWTNINGVDGHEVTGPNGNSIFLPVAGYRDGTDLKGCGNHGYYWSGSLCDGNGMTVHLLDFYRYFQSRNSNYRWYGLSVRPVCE